MTMLSSIFLCFKDPEIQTLYLQDSKQHYLKALPILTGLFLLLSLGLEVIYRLNFFNAGELTLTTTIVNWTITLIFFILSFLIRKFNYVHWLVCPLLTAFTFYYVTFNDYEGSVMGIFTTSCFGLTALLYIQVMFSEVWLLSTLTFAPLISFYMYKTSQSLKEIDMVWIVLFSSFQIFVYISVSYKIEKLSKQCFLGKENFDKSFARWFKIFESFPEGVAMIKEDGTISYSNPSLIRLLDLDQTAAQLDDKAEVSEFGGLSQKGRFSDSLTMKTMLETTKIKKWTQDIGSQVSGIKNQQSSVWDFIEKNEGGATFELKGVMNQGTEQNINRCSEQSKNASTRSPRINDTNDQTINQSADQHLNADKGANGLISPNSAQPSIAQGMEQQSQKSDGASRKFLSMNQVMVKIAGRNERIFIVRDESHIIWLKELEHTKKQMIDFTQCMMNTIDDYSSKTNSNLKELKMAEDRLQYIAQQLENQRNSAMAQDVQEQCSAQLELIEDCLSEMRRTRYSIRDYQYIYDISENNFFEPTYRRVNIRASLKEVVDASMNDLMKSQIEVQHNTDSKVPDFIPVEENLFHQIMINILQQVLVTIGTRGHLKINTGIIMHYQMPILVLNFDMNTILDDKQFIAAIKNVEREKDFKKILSAENVDTYFKIAKILCNQLNWMIELDCYKNLRYRLRIPLIHAVNDPLIDDDGEMEDEEVKDDSAIRQPHNVTREIQSANRGTRNTHQYRNQFDTQQNIQDQSSLQIDEFDSQSSRVIASDRPISTAPIEVGRRPRHYFNPIQEETEHENMDDLLINSPKIDEMSTRSFRQDTIQNRCKCPQALLLNSKYDKTEFEEKLYIKCDEVWDITNALKKIEKSISTSGMGKKCSCGRRGYKYFMIEAVDNAKSKQELGFLKSRLLETYQNAPVPQDLQNLKLYVFGSEAQEEQLKTVCNELQFKFFVRPDIQSLKTILLGRDDKGNDVERTASAVTITPTERSDV